MVYIVYGRDAWDAFVDSVWSDPNDALKRSQSLKQKQGILSVKVAVQGVNEKQA